MTSALFDYQSQSQGSITLKIIPAVAEDDKMKESRVRNPSTTVFFRWNEPSNTKDIMEGRLFWLNGLLGGFNVVYPQAETFFSQSELNAAFTEV